MTAVGARRRGQRGAHGARQSDERASTTWPAALVGRTTPPRLSARSSSSCRLKKLARLLAVNSSGAERGGVKVGRRSAVRPTRRMRRPTTRSESARRGRRRANKERITSGSALARCCRVGSRSRRGDGQRAATKLGVVASVGARRRGQHGAHGARRCDLRAPTVWLTALEGGTTRSRLSARSSSSCWPVQPAQRWA